MQPVAAGLGQDVNDRTAIAAVLGSKVRLQIEFLYRIDRQQRRRRAPNPRLIEGGVIEEGIVVVGAINRVIV